MIIKIAYMQMESLAKSLKLIGEFGQYVVEETWVEKINKNNIPVRHYNEKQSSKGYILYIEEIMYLVMVAEMPNNLQSYQNDKVKTNTLKQFYKRLSSHGYNSFDSVHFYFKMRKASKILYRNPLANPKQELACFKVFKNTEQFKQNKSGSLVVVVHNSQLIKDIIKEQLFQQKLPLKLYISGQMDGIAVKMEQPFLIKQI